MNDRAPGLRQRNFDDPRLSEAMRDIDDYMRGTLQVLRVDQFDALYTEPIYLALDSEPVGIVCVRVRELPALGTALVAGGVCPFEWDGRRMRAVVSKVPGLTTGTGTIYRFDFVTVG